MVGLLFGLPQQFAPANWNSGCLPCHHQPLLWGSNPWQVKICQKSQSHIASAQWQSPVQPLTPTPCASRTDAVHRAPDLFFAEGTERMDRERRNGAVANRFPEIKRESKSVRQTFAELLTGQHRKCFSLRQDHGKHVKFAQARRGCWSQQKAVDAVDAGPKASMG